jgi:hypothetical protein
MGPSFKSAAIIVREQVSRITLRLRRIAGN